MVMIPIYILEFQYFGSESERPKVWPDDTQASSVVFDLLPSSIPGPKAVQCMLDL